MQCNIDDSYIESLIETLSNTEFNIREKNNGYAEGMRAACSCFYNKRKERRKVIFIGNGGSAAIAIHMTADFAKNGGLRTINLYDSALITCLGNDYGYEHIFSRQIENVGDKGDMLIAISSSGNSENITNAIDSAHNAGMEVLSLTGFSPGNKTRKKSDFSIYVPSYKYGIVESCHNLILQQVVDMIRMKEAGEDIG